MSGDTDTIHMARAIQLAERGRYTTHPNPRVGCVLVKDGRVIGEGFHRRAGEPHAERNALAEAGVEAKGATAYVTLEPCSHYGKTPPCADALIEAGVSRVVAAMQDPNPLVSGKGFERLRAAGIEVDVGLLEGQAHHLNPGFIKRMHSGRPYVRCKLAMSLDGRTAMPDGESKWISSTASRADVHRLRASSSAILTGVGTVIADDPAMDVRLPPSDLGLGEEESIPMPVRVILDPELETPGSARMLSPPGECLILCREGKETHAQPLIDVGAKVMGVASDGQGLDLQAVVKLLADQGLSEILLESGATLAGGMLRQGLIDELIVYLAPHIMGDGARGLFRLPGLESMAERYALKVIDLRQIGPDIRITAKPEV
jgi:diaminohydroxyphosphoribosylaminopyrimidine deaminase/5-amino-6-(5-phosphoribosylamino)uracil reductase